MKPADIICHLSVFFLFLMFFATLLPDLIIMLIVNFIYKRYYPHKKEYNGYSFQLFQKVSGLAFKMLGLELIVDKPVK